MVKDASKFNNPYVYCEISKLVAYTGCRMQLTTLNEAHYKLNA